MARTMDQSDLLRGAYRLLQDRLGAEVASEPIEAVSAVYQHRLCWQPDHVRVLLLAESHVFTSAEEANAQVDVTRFGLSEVPSAYVRFVYCLGYGEDSIVSRTVPKNSGTPQFWCMFADCVATSSHDSSDAGVLKSREPDADARIRNKIALLQEMRQRGIWLVDASLIGLYQLGRKKPEADVMAEVVRLSWNAFWGVTLSDINPAHVVVIGRDVARWLAQPLEKTFAGRYTVVAQPNAHLSAEERSRERAALNAICRRHAMA